jgi:hypothetical protein
MRRSGGFRLSSQGEGAFRPLARLILTGGSQDAGADVRDDWRYSGARAIVIDAGTGNLIRTIEYSTPADLRAETTSLRFGSASLANGSLLICTGTEVLQYGTSDFTLTGRWSHPWMNSVHHVLPIENGAILVAATGLDMVLELERDGRLRRAIDLADHPIWDRFGRDVDFRRVPSTKPHECHINYLFDVAGSRFATRLVQRDAINIADPTDRFAIDAAGPHDGVVRDGRVYFTTVDGRIVIHDATSRRQLRIIDLWNRAGTLTSPLGWCRGLHIFGDELAWIGFSRLRPTRFRENLSWLRQKFNPGKHFGTKPTRIALYDLRTASLLHEINLEGFGLNTVYSVLPLT